ncbi:DUF1906 domain-containing protein [Dactylosporangium vinaceum]|nr:DUF1906 domain-containing protein [Dactylosporangium vinaceum]
MDEMVLKAQRWVNATYGSVPGYNRCAEDGSTGWQTIFSLTRALQVELGITSLSDSFGPTTFARLTAFGSVGQLSPNNNIRTIAEAGLYCKGYTGGDVDGFFGTRTIGGVMSMTQDMGLTPQDTISPKVFKALLTMDAYVLISGGDTYIRQAQQWMNRMFSTRRDFYISPCDGIFSRGVQNNLILAIQYRLGMADGTANGVVGPNTRSGLATQAYIREGRSDPAGSGFVLLFKAALMFNGYDGHWDDALATFDSRITGVTSRFQEFAKLQRTGEGDFDTWMSLLQSTGNPDRAATAMDCALPLTSATVATVKNAGIQYVGRYLSGGTTKILTSSEIALINDAGLSFFPLYQEFGDGPAYFSYGQGGAAGQAAVAKAHELGIPYGTVIYFSVDFDALASEIESLIIPHFRGVSNALRGDGSYAVGVYGTRNVCLKLAESGYATCSFVSDMSTGYSGNMGFRLPENWAFDQIKNTWIGGSQGTAGALEIDRDVASGRDVGVSSVTRPRDYNDAFYTYLIWVEARAQQWWDLNHHDRSTQELTAQYLRIRSGKNDGPGAGTTFGEIDRGFIDYVKTYPGRPDMASLRDPKLFRDTEPEHFGAVYGAVLNHTLDGDRRVVSLQDFGGWGGDLLSTLAQFTNTGLPDADAYEWSAAHIAPDGDVGFFNLSDYLADVDAFVFGTAYNAGDRRRLSEIFRSYYSNPAVSSSRFSQFYTQRFNGDLTVLRAAAKGMFVQTGDDLLDVARALFWQREGGTLAIGLVSDAVFEGVSRAFADVVVARATYS